MRARTPTRESGKSLTALLAAAAFFLSGSSGFTQESDSRPARRITTTEGVRIQVDAGKDPLSDEQLAASLEEAAQRLRGPKGMAKGFAIRADGGELPGTPTPAATPAALAPVPLMPYDVPERSGPRWICFPTSVLWAPPIANNYEPRFAALQTSLKNASTSTTVDTAIGGVIPFIRLDNSIEERDAWELDVFAVVFSRWKATRDSVGVDYRVGVPITRAIGPWEFKLAYEHTSTHVGDETMQRLGRRYVAHTKDELVVGAAYRFLEAFRVYGIFGYAFRLQSAGPDDPTRYEMGLEWSSPLCTGWHGRPYAAVDLEFRGDQNFYANFTSQLGWQWRSHDFGPNLRLGLEYYRGRSPYGQFFLDEESWIGGGMFFGF